MPENVYHHGDLKQQLIREGLRLLDAEGYDGLSLRKVAKACRVSQTAPYRHFKSKDELIAAITMQAMAAFNERLKQSVRQHPDDPASALRDMGLAYIIFFMENPEYLRLLFLGDLQEKMRLAGYQFDECVSGHCTEDDHPFHTLFNAVTRYKEARPDLTVSQDELVISCWGLVHGISTLIAAGQLPDGEETLQLARKSISSWLV